MIEKELIKKNKMFRLKNLNCFENINLGMDELLRNFRSVTQNNVKTANKFIGVYDKQKEMSSVNDIDPFPFFNRNIHQLRDQHIINENRVKNI